MSDEKIMLEIASELGKVTEHWGLSSITGKAFMIIYFSGPITQDEIMKSLKCSRGAISQALTILTTASIIEISGKKGRKNLYSANTISKAKRKQMEYMLRFQLQPMRQFLEEKQKEAKNAELKIKIKELEKMYSRAESALELILKLPFGK